MPPCPPHTNRGGHGGTAPTLHNSFRRAIPNNRLHTELDLDYRRLRDLLASGVWKKADLETRSLMLTVSRQQKRGWLSRLDILNINSTDLNTIDTLWLHYSNRRFGFSVQKRIWLSIGGQVDVYNYEIYKKFSESVGWFLKAEWLPGYNLSEKDGLWLCYEDLNFTINAPNGHLPVAQDSEWLAALTSRF